MTRDDVLLAILAASNGRPYTPVQIQKAVFLVTRNLPRLVTQGNNFDFEPYDYGPFDQNVYAEAEALSRNGLAEIIRQDGVRWNKYAASDTGVGRGEQILESMTERERSYVREVAQWVGRKHLINWSKLFTTDTRKCASIVYLEASRDDYCWR